jgi:Flp pilus assembly protein TadG
MRTLQSFLRDRAGNIGMIFCASLFAIVGSAGLAVDYSRAGTARAELQASLDSAILASARRASTGDANALNAVERFVEASFAAKHPEMSVEVTASTTPDGRVVATATGRVPMALMQVLGVSEVPIAARAAAQFGAGAAEVALVLDNTRSMQGSKMDALKQGAKELVDILFEPRDAQLSVRVGVVPFAQYVNVGMSYRNESWMSVAPDSSTPGEYCRNEYPNAVSSNCRPHSYTAYDDGMPYTVNTTICDTVYGDPVWTCSPTVDTQTWNGCAGSRPYPIESSASDDFSVPVPGAMNTSCPQPLTRLSNNPASIKSEIEAMTTVGETYMPAGLAWGWRILSPRGPFGDGDDVLTRPDLKKFLVLMTDGSNTISPTYPKHEGGDKALANDLTAETCASIKARGTYIYAIAFEVPDPVIQDVLKDCATAPPYYYVAEDSDDLREAFAAIANSISAVRLTQ